MSALTLAPSISAGIGRDSKESLSSTSVGINDIIKKKAFAIIKGIGALLLISLGIAANFVAIPLSVWIAIPLVAVIALIGAHYLWKKYSATDKAAREAEEELFRDNINTSSSPNIDNRETEEERKIKLLRQMEAVQNEIQKIYQQHAHNFSRAQRHQNEMAERVELSSGFLKLTASIEKIAKKLTDSLQEGIKLQGHLLEWQKSLSGALAFTKNIFGWIDRISHYWHNEITSEEIEAWRATLKKCQKELIEKNELHREALQICMSDLEKKIAHLESKHQYKQGKFFQDLAFDSLASCEAIFSYILKADFIPKDWTKYLSKANGFLGNFVDLSSLVISFEKIYRNITKIIELGKKAAECKRIMSSNMTSELVKMRIQSLKTKQRMQATKLIEATFKTLCDILKVAAIVAALFMVTVNPAITVIATVCGILVLTIGAIHCGYDLYRLSKDGKDLFSVFNARLDRHRAVGQLQETYLKLIDAEASIDSRVRRLSHLKRPLTKRESDGLEVLINKAEKVKALYSQQKSAWEEIYHRQTNAEIKVKLKRISAKTGFSVKEIADSWKSFQDRINDINQRSHLLEEMRLLGYVPSKKLSVEDVFKFIGST